MQILPALENGGVERGTIDIAKALKKIDIEPIVVSKGGILVYQLREAGINHIKLSTNSKNPLTIFLNIGRIVNLINQYKVDLVHVRSRAPMWSAYFACKKTRTKLITTVHGTYSLNLGAWKVFPLKKLYNRIMLKADRIIAVSNFIKEYLANNYGKKNQKLSPKILRKISVIQRGVDLQYFNIEKISQSRIVNLITKWNLPEDRKIILLPARFTAWKGHEFLIETLKKVKNDFCCIMVGSDHGHKKFRRKIEEKIVDAGLCGKVKIVGVCKDMAAAYALSHIVVSTSIKPEAFGRIAIEAQAMERIIIATKIGGALETIIDKKTGFLVEVGDSENFARLIDEVLNFSQEQDKKISKAARYNAEQNFSNQKMCDDTIAIYRELID
ncbi:MAG: glycosyltransferase family 4 protein [Rickettsiales bacterium]|nr:glycosyltransferase family 4 protein [Rickettsiales bacterium]